MTVQDKARALIAHPAALGWALGYKDFLPNLHGEWIRWIVTGEKDGTLQAHRGSYKTTCLCVGIALLMMKERGKNMIFLRKTDNDVAEVVQNVDRILQSPVMQEIYLALTGTRLEIIKSTNTEITTSAYNAPRGSAQLLGIGIGGSLTGKHADIIITDDIVNLKDRQSRAERDRTKAVYMELQNVKNRGGRIINTGTPWHKEDCFSLMPEPIKFDCYQTGLLSKGQIETLRQSMSPSLFAANYELRHIASDDVIFPNPQTGAELTLAEQGTGHIDAAYHGEDFTAYTMVHLVGGKYYVFGKMWRRHIDDVLDDILDFHHSLKGGKLYCEENSDKGYLGKELRKRGERVVIYSEHMNKYLKITSYLKFEWENVIFVQGTDPEYIEQIEDFNDNSEHDDAPDSLSSLIRVMPNKAKHEGRLNLWG